MQAQIRRRAGRHKRAYILAERRQAQYGTAMPDATDSQLAAQYEAFPYPRRDPRDEARRLVVGSPSHLHEIDHWVFGAGRPRSLGLRALIAGGGTGDGTIMLAQQLARAGRSGRVTYLDRSAAAMAVAQARAATRGLTNIDWQRGSLLELPGGLGLFDYIDCCGVLHHLPDPAEGLAALVRALAPGGGIGLMVYAPHGRTGVYPLQDALRLLAPEDEPPATRLDVARRVMRHLPESAWLRQNRSFGDHFEGGDAGLYDLLLNPRDRAFTVTALHELLAGAGLEVACWVEPLRYEPGAYLPDARLRARIGELDPVARAACAEGLCGNMGTHVVYCVRAGERPERPDSQAPTAVPVAREIPAQEIAAAIQADGMLVLNFDGLRMPLALPAQARAILGLIDGRRTVGEIGATLTGRGMAPAAFQSAWRATFAALESVNRLLLASPR